MRLESRPRRFAQALALAALLSAARPAHAEPGEELRISILTFGPGDHPFYKFGHNAILVVGDPRAPVGAVYNFGTFDFESPWLILGFLDGKLNYWLSIQSLSSRISAYQSENRPKRKIWSWSPHRERRSRTPCTRTRAPRTLLQVRGGPHARQGPARVAADGGGGGRVGARAVLEGAPVVRPEQRPDHRAPLAGMGGRRRGDLLAREAREGRDGMIPAAISDPHATGLQAASCAAM